MNDIKQIPVSCNKDCGAGCPLIAHIKQGKIVKITDNKKAPEFVQGCPRGYLFHKVLYSEKRLLNPLKRVGSRCVGQFKEISWDEAYQLISKNLRNVLSKYGAESIMLLPGSGSCRGVVHNTDKLLKRFFSFLGNCTWGEGNYSSQAVSFAQPYVLGTKYGGVDPETLKDSKQVILWGANLADTRFSAKVENVLKYLRERDVPIIVIDPRKTRTVEKYSTKWLKISPASDTALMSSIAYIFINEGLIDPDFIKKYSTGFDEYKSYILGEKDGIPKSPEWAGKICGLSVKDIKTLASDYLKYKPTALIPGLSIQRTVGGEEASRAAIVLQLLTGNIALKGGTSGGKFWNGLPTPFIPSIFEKSLNPGNKFSVYRWPDVILSDKSPEIKMLYITGHNFLNQGSDIRKNIKAFSKLDFIVAHDSFLTPTAMMSDVILPITMWPERSDVVNCSDNFICYTHKVVEHPKNVKNDYDIFADLSCCLGTYKEFTENRTADEWLEYLLSKSEIDDIIKFKEVGFYEGAEKERTAFIDFFYDPKKFPLKTPSGLIEISSKQYAETGFPSVPEYRKIEHSQKFPLILITPHAKYRINSSNWNIDYFNRLEDDTLWISYEDAKERGITDGQKVVVYNQRGKLEVAAKVTDDIIKGAVSLNQGIWVQSENRLGLLKNAPNILTSTSPTMPSEGSRTHLTFVEVIKNS